MSDGELLDNEPNADSIMADVRRGSAYVGQVDTHSNQRRTQTPGWDQNDIALLQFHARSLNQPSVQLEIELDLTSTALDRLPVIGALWRRLRRMLHEVSLHYVRKVTLFLNRSQH
jgi:hypothetical protein